MNKPSQLAITTAAQIWQQPTTSDIEMDTRLAEAIAQLVDRIWSEPWLGNATTRQLIEELQARVEVGSINGDYRSAEPRPI